MIIQTKDCKLELDIYIPNNPIAGVIISHPYGPLGGNMDNNVVVHLFNYFKEKGNLIVCRYNARGVGKSGGRTTFTSKCEESDGIEVIKYVLQYTDKIILCGYSYGLLNALTKAP
jgi:alpha/beta superfamily hydrolase